MMAQFTKQSFNVNGSVDVTLHSGKTYRSNFPRAVWRWLQGRDWSEVVVTDNDFTQSYGWDRN